MNACRAAAMSLVLTAAMACQPVESSPERDSGEERIAAAVLAAPTSMRAGATVLGHDGSGELSVLREGSGVLVCLADDPGQEGFRVACYHRDLEPFMARGRELRAGGVGNEAADSVRLAEVRAGTLSMPARPVALFNLGAPSPPEDPESGDDPPESRRLTVLYVPGATPESLGLPPEPQDGMPWLMTPGTPEAHVMFSH